MSLYDDKDITELRIILIWRTGSSKFYWWWNDSLAHERFKIQIMDLLSKLWIIFYIYRERFHNSTKEVAGFEFEIIMDNS